MAVRPNIIATIKSGQALAAVSFIRETLNWVFQWVANLKLGRGLKWENRNSDHPTISTDIRAGNGITVEDVGFGGLKISATGGSGGGNVSDVSGTSNNNQIKVQYADSTPDKTITVFTGENESSLEIVTGVHYDASTGNCYTTKMRLSIVNGIVTSISTTSGDAVFTAAPVTTV